MSSMETVPTIVITVTMLQVVLAGCEGEVHMYSLFVDDTGQAGQEAVATAGRALAQGQPLPQVSHPLGFMVFGCEHSFLHSLIHSFIHHSFIHWSVCPSVRLFHSLHYILKAPWGPARTIRPALPSLVQFPNHNTNVHPASASCNIFDGCCYGAWRKDIRRMS